MPLLTVFPNAKVNLFLEVLGKREDGYHAIHSFFIPITLTDRITFEKSAIIELDTDNTIDCNPHDNLVWKAAMLLKQEFGINQGAKIRLEKNIPFGAGLGGGSSDAAFTLKALNSFWNINTTDEHLMELAEKIGSDCPFFIKNKPALVTGRGEHVENIEFTLTSSILIVCPSTHISTPEAYRMLGFADSSALLTHSCIVSDFSTYRNDFEKEIFKKHTFLQDIKNTLLNSGAYYSGMSGSGSTIFGLFEDSIKVKNAQKQLPYPSFIVSQFTD